MSIIDKLQGKINPHKFLYLESTGVSNEKLEPPEDKNNPRLSFDKMWPYLKIESFKFLAQKRISYTHEEIINIYIVYLMPDITHAKGYDYMSYGLFGATTYDNKAWKGYGVALGSQTYQQKDGSICVGLSDFNNALGF